MTQSRHILIIDDSRVSRMMIHTIIANKQPDWVIHEAGNSDEAQQLAAEFPVDYFTVDLNMPGINGFELVERLKTSHPQAHFVILTANIQEATHKKSAEIGARCVNKPITEKTIDSILEYFNE